jgi:hypothetical protein
LFFYYEHISKGGLAVEICHGIEENSLAEVNSWLHSLEKSLANCKNIFLRLDHTG